MRWFPLLLFVVFNFQRAVSLATAQSAPSTYVDVMVPQKSLAINELKMWANLSLRSSGIEAVEPPAEQDTDPLWNSCIREPGGVNARLHQLLDELPNAKSRLPRGSLNPFAEPPQCQ